jgi:ABC-type Fe3+/spermidine/putrescine transport system ATPase subunit
LGGAEDVYRKPANLFVAQFMGTTNVLSGVAGRHAGGSTRVIVGSWECIVDGLDAREGEPLILCIRPEALRIVLANNGGAPAGACMQATLKKAEFSGAMIRVEAELPGGIPLKIAVLDDPHARLLPGSQLSLAILPA